METALLFFYVFWSLCLQGLSFLLVGGSQYTAALQSSFGDVLLWKHVHPNLSVLWYLNMEIFERYRVYFAVLIGGLPYLLLVPITIRLHRYPMVLVSRHEFLMLQWWG
jgi:GPI transamidase subunit PIG-U